MEYMHAVMLFLNFLETPSQNRLHLFVLLLVVFTLEPK